eukprot:TRINITY_DN5409_c0_g2_i1.p1 TRINITY_DN5409_c0_g2~~TRINITY_DN5409_c0_g2_i1.p1  ORF type:complete len:157 (-),score=27.23 TRINITY_DN5409_c0_g2_i1:58-528(-)
MWGGLMGQIIVMEMPLIFVYVFMFFFFFQAEDGIRDFCLSRGLGDVYKRQTQPRYQILDKFAEEVQVIVESNKSQKQIPELLALTSELAAFFWLKYFTIETTISWSEFTTKFQQFIEQLESQNLTTKQLNIIREYIDEDYDNLITVEALTSFLDLV